MNREVGFKMVQAQIGYTFQSKELLEQAFVRRSYTEENGGENNEILEFIGDKALDLAVIHLLIEKYGTREDKENEPEENMPNPVLQALLSPPRSHSAAFSCSRTEGDLTRIKSRMVEKRNLAQRIDELGFAEFLLMGKSDVKNDVGNERSVKEDLFEAIVGAVTLDCNWDFPTIRSVVEAMLLPEDFLDKDTEENYVRLILDWSMQVNHTLPGFWFCNEGYLTVAMGYADTPFHGVSQYFSPWEYRDLSRLKVQCQLNLCMPDVPIFRGFGESKSEARMSVCKLAYEYLEKEGYIQEMSMADEIEEPAQESAINQLEILARRGYFSIPAYEFQEKYDKDGNPIWMCRCRIKEYPKTFSQKSSAKKEAKKKAALKMLQYVLKEDEKEREANEDEK